MGAGRKVMPDPSLTVKPGEEQKNRTGRAVFLDRDGVLNQVIVSNNVSYPPAAVEQLEIMPGAVEATAQLRKMGFYLLVVTNQPDVARGRQTKERVEAINRYLQAELGLDAVYTCYHDSSDGCNCRKPLPGLLFQATREYPIRLEKSFMVGDRYNDVQAGRQAGCATFLFDQGHAGKPTVEPNYRVNSLAEVVNIITGLLQKEEK